MSSKFGKHVGRKHAPAQAGYPASVRQSGKEVVVEVDDVVGVVVVARNMQVPSFSGFVTLKRVLPLLLIWAGDKNRTL